MEKESKPDKTQATATGKKMRWMSPKRHTVGKLKISKKLYNIYGLPHEKSYQQKKRTKCMQQLTNKTQEHSQSLFFVPFKRFDCCKRKENMFFQGNPFFSWFHNSNEQMNQLIPLSPQHDIYIYIYYIYIYVCVCVCVRVCVCIGMSFLIAFNGYIPHLYVIVFFSLLLFKKDPCPLLPPRHELLHHPILPIVWQ